MPQLKKLYDTQTLIETHAADQEFIKHMVSLFVKNIPDNNTALQKASNENDWQKVFFYAHKMKASIDLFNLNELKDLIRSVEHRAKNLEETETIAKDVNLIHSYMQQCVAAMKEEFQLK